MSFKAVLGLVLISLLAFEPAIASAPMLGQVVVRGQAKINGVAATTGATIFGGDQVATGADAVAELHLNGGSTVLLPATTAVGLNRAADQLTIDLSQGALAVLSMTSSPTSVDAIGARITPHGGTSAVVEVAVAGTSLKVLARRGSATVETADMTLEIPEGKELDATMAPALDAPQGRAGTRAAGRGKLEAWVFITAVGAGITGLVLGILAIKRPNPRDCTFISTSGKIICP